MRTITFQWDGKAIPVGVDDAGDGPLLVLLPALSSISTRGEMRPLFDRLAPDFHVVSVDWPGFGELGRPKVAWSPTALSAFLDWFLSQLPSPPAVLVAAGHAATYALHYAAQRPGAVDRLALIAPTWRGPLPTMMRGQRPWFATVRSLIESPGLGALLYRLNVSQFVVNMMARAHVYSDPDFLSGDRLAAKMAVTRAAGARYGSARFVTGHLDRAAGREGFLNLARRAGRPTLVVIGKDTPQKSRAEMEALADLPDARVHHAARGKLSVHEEFPEEVCGAVRAFALG